jgi:hypothetical protein
MSGSDCAAGAASAVSVFVFSPAAGQKKYARTPTANVATIAAPTIQVEGDRLKGWINS